MQRVPQDEHSIDQSDALERVALPVFVLVQFVSSVLFAAIRSVLAATAYVQLRQDRDGSPSELANVFS